VGEAHDGAGGVISDWLRDERVWGAALYLFAAVLFALAWRKLRGR